MLNLLAKLILLLDRLVIGIICGAFAIGLVIILVTLSLKGV